MTPSPTAPGIGLGYKTCPLFTHSIYIGKHAYILGWGGTNFLLGGFPRVNFPWGRNFPGSEIFRGNYALGEFARILIQSFFYVLLSLFRLNFTRGVVKSNCPG